MREEVPPPGGAPRRGGPFGDLLLPLLFHDLRDRVAGRRGRANARWGFVSPPAGRGPVIWVSAGACRDSVLLGAGLVAAIREKRLDVRIVLSVEAEFSDATTRLAELEKVAWGYGACDRAASVRRLLMRLSPLGVLFTGRAPRPGLAAALGGVSHVLAIGDATPFPCEFAYPASPSGAAAWGDAPHGEPADLVTLLVEAQADPVLRAIVSGGQPRTLCWLHDPQGEVDATLFLDRFRARVPNGILFVSGRKWPASGSDVVRTSEWARTPLAAGTVMSIDDPRWIAAVAVAADAAHIVVPERHAIWQACAAGCPASCGVQPYWLADETLRVRRDAEALLEAWSVDAGAFASRQYGDQLRRRFWSERRRAATVADALLKRVFEWD